MQDAAIPSAPQPLSSRYRAISLAEVALGTFLVIGHNVFHIVPNEVPFLAGALLLLLLHSRSWL